MRKDVWRRAILAGMATGAAALTPAAALAAFPGLNGKIAYSHQLGESSASSAAIYAVGANGGAPSNLSAVGAGTTMTADLQSAWSADGKHIAFVRVDFAHCSGQIWTMRQDGTGQTNLSNDAATANEINPAYGPDGSIVFVRTGPGTFNICNMTPSNQGNLWVRSPKGKLRQLTSSGADNTPAWSPDGSKVAFTHVRPGGPPHIFVINVNGTRPPKDLGPGLKPNWSPDGSKIVFAAPGAPNGPTGGPVTVMNANGSNRHTLNANGTAPVWSPDGKEIGYVTFDQATRSTLIGVMKTNGQNQHNITNPGLGNNDVKPDWQPIIRRLRLTVTPRTATSGVATCFAFRASSGGKAVAQVKIVVAHHHASTSRNGRAQICVTLHTGRDTASGSEAGYRVAAATVLVRRPLARGNPRLTG
jgi:hypothetical protein